MALKMCKALRARRITVASALKILEIIFSLLFYILWICVLWEFRMALEYEYDGYTESFKDDEKKITQTYTVMEILR